MESYSARRKSKSFAALIFLTLIGVGFLLFSLVAITCGFVLNYHEDFEATDGGQSLESQLAAEFDYSQYWLGFPFFITAILSIASGTFQNRRSLTTATILSFHVCIVLALFAIVLEGTDWVLWKNLDRKHRLWENKDGYTCNATNTTCICYKTTTPTSIETISSTASCSNITTLSGLYGGIVASAITGIFLSLAGIVVALKSLSWKGRHRYIKYDLRRINPEGAYWNGTATKEPPSMAGKINSGKSTALYP